MSTDTASVEFFADILRSMGYAVQIEPDALILPRRWRVHRYGRWWIVSDWLQRGTHGWWERYHMYADLQEAIEKGVQL